MSKPKPRNKIGLAITVFEVLSAITATALTGTIWATTSSLNGYGADSVNFHMFSFIANGAVLLWALVQAWLRWHDSRFKGLTVKQIAIMAMSGTVMLLLFIRSNSSVRPEGIANLLVPTITCDLVILVIEIIPLVLENWKV